jgi:sugar phosphate isomerase/epimerase
MEMFNKMKLSISNIAWLKESDVKVFDFLCQNNFTAIEIAPTRLFSNNPYNYITEAKNYAQQLKNSYNLTISSMQSIWYGLNESIFGTNIERQKLLDYTKQAINFAIALNCPNIVFGCPKNRNIPDNLINTDYLPAVKSFFNELGNYAISHNTTIAIEPNPVIYNANFINTTSEAFGFCKALNNSGIKVNIDLGTIIYNNEDINILKDDINLVNNIHISEPHLAVIEERTLHKNLIKVLRSLNYNKFISIEMANTNNIEVVKKTILYLKELTNAI